VKRLPDEKRVWVARAAEAAHAAVCRRSHDVVISFGQPWSDHLIARRLVRRIAMPWVAHFSDPWVGSPYTRGGAWQRRLNEQMERDVVSTATRIVFQNAETAEYTMSRYPAEWRAKTAVIPQGFDPTVTAGPRPSDVSRTRPLSVVYTGRFYPGVRTPDTLLEAVGRLHARERLDARLHVDFFGHPWAPYARRAHTLGIDSVVTFHGRIAPPEAQAAAARADVLLIIDAPSAGPNLFLPSKAVDYLPLRRPMLAITPTVGATAALMNRLRYPVVDPADIAGMEQALRELIAEHEAGTLAASMTHDEVAREYDIREIAGRFDALLRGIVPSAAARRPPLVGVS
jgi:glycosyltransferase involved in cell wall biosynthesis